MKITCATLIVCALILVSCTHDVRPLVDRATKLRDAGDLDLALTLFNQALRDDPSSSPAFNGRGLTRKLLGDTVGALSDYDLAIQFDTNNCSAYNNRGVLLDCRGRYAAALSDLDRAIQGDNKDHLFLFNRVGAKIHAHDFLGALGDIKQLRALGVMDQYPRLYYQEGFAYAQLDSSALAEVRFNEYLKRDPKGCVYEECLVNRAINRLNLDMFDSAYTELKRAEMGGNRSYEIYYHEGYALRRLMQYSKALEAYNLAAAMDSTDAFMTWCIGECKEQVGDATGACVAYHRAVQLGYEDVDKVIPRLCQN